VTDDADPTPEDAAEHVEDATKRAEDAARLLQERAEAIREELERWETGDVDDEEVSLQDVMDGLDRWEVEENAADRDREGDVDGDGDRSG
jgi:uncharacterized membrane protein